MSFPLRYRAVLRRTSAGRRRLVVLATVALAAAIGLTLFSATVSEAARRSPQEASQGPMPVFEFHSGFWTNLHHFLYQQARLREGVRASRSKAVEPPDSGAVARTGSLAQAEQQAWSAALAYYAEQLSGQDLLVNGDMVNIRNRLTEMEPCADLSGRSSSACASGLREGLIGALERAAPVYRARWWPVHDQSNRAWISAVSPMVRQLGGALAQQLAATYQSEWPAARLRVDVVFYGGPFGAYTTLDPVHLTISSADARNQGPAALEVLFHEGSHALAGAVRDAIVRECRARGKPIPRDLWHALLFYTAGEIVKRALRSPDSGAGLGAANYTPYAYRHGLYARGWQSYQRVLERHWQPYLEGQTEFDTAVARLVSAL